MKHMAAMFPERRLAVALLRRGTTSWILVRMVVAAAPLLVSDAAMRLDANAALGVIVLTGLVGLARARLRNEPRFLPNLGISPTVTASLSVIPAVLAEIAVGVLSSA